jgi:hypothetical protein
MSVCSAYGRITDETEVIVSLLSTVVGTGVVRTPPFSCNALDSEKRYCLIDSLLTEGHFNQTTKQSKKITTEDSFQDNSSMLVFMVK